MNALRRRFLIAAASLAPGIAKAGGLGRIAEALSGKAAASAVTLVLVDQSASVNAEDAAIYQRAFGAFAGIFRAGDRFVIGAISDRSIGRFVPVVDRSVVRTSIVLDDREAAVKARQALESAFGGVLVPGRRVIRSLILDTIDAAAELLAGARHAKKNLVLLTDGVEESGFADFTRMELDAHAARRLIERRKAGGSMPSLTGVDVWIIGAGGETNEKYFRLRAFWSAYFEASGARLVHYGRSVPELR